MDEAEDINERIIEGKMILNQKKISELIKNETFNNNHKIEWFNFYYESQAENNIPYEFFESKRNEQTTEKYKIIFKYLTKTIIILINCPDRILNIIDLFLKEIFDEELN